MRLIDADKIDDKYREIKIGAGFADDEEISPKDALYFLNLAIDAMPTVDVLDIVCKKCRAKNNLKSCSKLSCYIYQLFNDTVYVRWREDEPTD